MAVTFEKAGANTWVELANTLDIKRLGYLVDELKDERYGDNKSDLLKALKGTMGRQFS